MVLEEVAAEFFAQGVGGVEQAAIAFPGFGIEELLFLLFGQALLFGAAVLLLVAVLFVIIAPVGEARFQLDSDIFETGE